MTWTPLPTLVHPPIEWLGFAFYRAYQDDWAVDMGTRLPGPQEDQTVLQTGFLRFEAGGGSEDADTQGLMFNLDLIMHSYYGEDEDAAKDISQQATLLGGRIPRDTVVQCPLTRNGPALPWTIHDARGFSEPTRTTDPMVNMIRYRSMVTWRVVGREA